MLSTILVLRVQLILTTQAFHHFMIHLPLHVSLCSTRHHGNAVRSMMPAMTTSKCSNHLRRDALTYLHWSSARTTLIGGCLAQRVCHTFSPEAPIVSDPTVAIRAVASSILFWTLAC